MMANFPTLSVSGPDSGGYNEAYQDVGNLVSDTEAGYKIARRQFTRRPKVFSGLYFPLTDSDKVTMEAFINTHGTTGSFTWAQPITSVAFDVRFSTIPKFDRRGIFWAMTFELEEV